MKVYAFIGAGPANLHRALLIKETEPDATFVFFDPRFETDGIGEFTYERSRDMIFRLDTRIDREIRRLFSSFNAGYHYRSTSTEPELFNPATNQSDDQDILGDSDFIQIQIRDLQRAFLLELASRGNCHFIKQAVADDDDDLIVRLIEERQAALGVSVETLDEVEIHRGRGALRDSEVMNTIIYPTKLAYSPDEDISDDLRAFLTVPEHGLTTFHYTDIGASSFSLLGAVPLSRGNGLIRSQLLFNRRSLDNTAWQRLSEEPFGWSLSRPPRVRLFATNGVLYVAAETPAHWSSLSAGEYNERLVNYTQLIASLVLPSFSRLHDIGSFEPKSVSRLQTPRGERGDVYKEEVLLLSNMRPYTRKTHFLGDGVYLPQYQTGSGFVSSYDRNLLFNTIRQIETLSDVLRAGSILNLFNLDHLGLDNLHLIDIIRIRAIGISTNSGEPINRVLLRNPVVRRLVEQYAKQLGLPTEGDFTEEQVQQIVEVMKVELLMAGSRDIIQQNKEKVSTYFLALERQAVSGLLRGLNFSTSVHNYNNDAPVGSEIRETVSEDSTSRMLYLIMMIAKGSHRYLRDVIPQLINVDLSEATDEDLERFRLLLMYNLVKNHESHFSPILEDISAARNAREGLAHLIGETPRLEESFTQYILRHHVIFFRLIQSMPTAQFTRVVEQITGHLRVEARALQPSFLQRLINSLSGASEPPSFGLPLPRESLSASRQFFRDPLFDSAAFRASGTELRHVEGATPFGHDTLRGLLDTRLSSQLVTRRGFNRSTGAQAFAASRSRLFPTAGTTPFDLQLTATTTTGRAATALTDSVRRAATHTVFNRFFPTVVPGAAAARTDRPAAEANEEPRAQTEPNDDFDSIIDARHGN